MNIKVAVYTVIPVCRIIPVFITLLKHNRNWNYANVAFHKCDILLPTFHTRVKFAAQQRFLCYAHIYRKVKVINDQENGAIKTKDPR